MTNKQEQLVRYDQNLHEIEIQSKYTKEECSIQEKEIVRLNELLEEQGDRIQILQQDFLKVQEEVNQTHWIHSFKQTFSSEPFQTLRRVDWSTFNCKINIFLGDIVDEQDVPHFKHELR